MSPGKAARSPGRWPRVSKAPTRSPSPGAAWTSALKRGYRQLYESHRRWWQDYWAKSSVRLPNPVIERQWYLETYKFGAASRRGAPPITLQAVWTADDGKLPPWKGDYHHDLNTQLSYWPCYSGNRLEEGLAYLDWLWKTRDTAFDWTRRFFGLPGLNVPMTADLNGNQIGGWRQYTHSATTAAWLAHHFYLHWRYSGDREFLRTRAYPYLRDAAVFIEAFTAKRDANGKRTHPLSASPEINDNRPTAWFATVTNYDLALDRWLMSAAAELAGGTWQPAGRGSALAGGALRVARFQPRRRRTLLVAAGYPLPASHRHFSHLMAIHPLGLIDWRRRGRAAHHPRIAGGTGPARLIGLVRLQLLVAGEPGGTRPRRREGRASAGDFRDGLHLRNSFHCNGDQSGKGYSKFTYRPFTLEGNFAEGAGRAGDAAPKPGRMDSRLPGRSRRLEGRLFQHPARRGRVSGIGRARRRGHPQSGDRGGKRRALPAGVTVYRQAAYVSHASRRTPPAHRRPEVARRLSPVLAQHG